MKIKNLFSLSVLCFALLLSFFVFSSPVLAKNGTGCDTSEEGLNLGDCFLLNEDQTVKSVYTSPAFLLNLIVRYAFIIAGMMLFFFFLYGGYLFITGDAKGKDKAAETITQAVIGFIVMFCAYWILQIIAYVTGANITL